MARDVQAAKAALNFKTPRAGILDKDGVLPALSTVEQVHVYNSPSARSPIHLNNIMISVKRKLEEEPVGKTSKKSKDTKHKLAISEMKKFGLTSL